MNAELMEQGKMWHFLAKEMRHWDAPLFADLCDGIAEDENLLDVASHTRAGQPPVQFLAAVQYLLLQGARHDLRRHFPSLNEGQKPEGDILPVFKDFCARYREEIVDLIGSRVTNTNEIARSAGLNAGFRALAAEAGEPLHLIEVGPSAGFNLLWDRFEINYIGQDGTSHKSKARAPLLTVEIELKPGGIPPLNAPPETASRVGLELNPVNLDNPDERDWLRAVIYADHVARHERIAKVLALSPDERAEIRGGDAIALLPDALSRLPAGGVACVYHTFAVYQFSPEMQQALEDIFIKASLSRPVWRLSNEWGPEGKCPLTLTCYDKGNKQQKTLAYCSIHGWWIEWCA